MEIAYLKTHSWNPLLSQAHFSSLVWRQRCLLLALQMIFRGKDAGNYAAMQGREGIVAYLKTFRQAYPQISCPFLQLAEVLEGVVRSHMFLIFVADRALFQLRAGSLSMPEIDHLQVISQLS